ncbi:hypothetical protein VYU27_008296 [Nannochloropsis oceanica]
MAHAAVLNPHLVAVPVAVAPHQLPRAVAIHEATRNQDFEGLALLLEEDPSLIHAEDVVGRSPLMMSSLRGHVEVSAWLLDHGAPLDAVDVNKRTAMYNAASYGFVEVVKLLMERGADPSIGDCEGNVPIIAAAYYGYEQCVRYLLDFKGGHDPDDLARKGERRWTGLYLSCEAGHSKIAKLFLRVGADPTIADSQGNTALDIARKMSNWRCARLLERALKEPQRVDYLKKAHLLAEAGHALRQVAVVVEGERAGSEGGQGGRWIKTRGGRKRKYVETVPECLKKRVKEGGLLPMVGVGEPKLLLLGMGAALAAEMKGKVGRRRKRRRRGSDSMTTMMEMGRDRGRGSRREESPRKGQKGEIYSGRVASSGGPASAEQQEGHGGGKGRKVVRYDELDEEEEGEEEEEEGEKCMGGLSSRLFSPSSSSFSPCSGGREVQGHMTPGKVVGAEGGKEEDEDNEVVGVINYLINGGLPSELFVEVTEYMRPRWMA